MKLERYLDGSEERMVGHPEAFIVEHRGRLGDELISRTVDNVSAKHPALRAHIIHEGQRCKLEAPGSARLRVVIREGSEGVLRDEVHSPWNPEHGVAKLIVVRSAQCGYVALRLDHSIFDGRSMFNMLNELWHVYAQTQTGLYESPTAAPTLPCAPADLFNERWSELLPSSSSARLSDKTPITEKFTERRIHLSRLETKRLIASAQNNQTSVHGVICGAILIGQSFSLSSSRSESMILRTAIDLRNHVKPIVGASETTNFLGLHEAKVSIRSGTTPGAVGRAVKQNLDAALAKRELAKPSGSTVEHFLSSATVSNLGSLPQIPVPFGLRIVDLMLTRPQKGSWLKAPFYTAYTFDEQATIYALCPSALLNDSEMDRLVDQIKYQLVNA